MNKKIVYFNYKCLNLKRNLKLISFLCDRELKNFFSKLDGLTNSTTST